jgi:hypothetical protein
MTIPNPLCRAETLLPYLHAAIGFLTPEMERIRQPSRGETSRRAYPIFTELRTRRMKACGSPGPRCGYAVS